MQDRQTRKTPYGPSRIPRLSTLVSEGSPGGNLSEVYSPNTNPFAPRPDTRTPTGFAMASMTKLKPSPSASQASPAAGSPEITTSQDGRYYDIDLCPQSPDVSSKIPIVKMEALVSDADAADWLSSPKMDLTGIKASWDSVSKLEPLEPLERAASPPAKKGILMEADAGQESADIVLPAKAPGAQVTSPTADSEASEDAWKIAAVPAVEASAPAEEARPAEAAPVAEAPAVDVAPSPFECAAALGTLASPSPARAYPRSFPVEETASGLRSLTGSYTSWVGSPDSTAGSPSKRPSSSPPPMPDIEAPVNRVDGGSASLPRLEVEAEVPQVGAVVAEAPEVEVEDEVDAFAGKENVEEEAANIVANRLAEVQLAAAAAAAAAQHRQQEKAWKKALQVAVASAEGANAFASPISLAASPSPTAGAAKAAVPSPSAIPGRRSRVDAGVVLCVLATIGALAAALLLGPSALPLAGQATWARVPQLAIFPQGAALPQLQAQLAGWAAEQLPADLADRVPAWLQPTVRSLQSRLAAMRSAQPAAPSPTVAEMLTKGVPPPPASWAKKPLTQKAAVLMGAAVGTAVGAPRPPTMREAVTASLMSAFSGKAPAVAPPTKDAPAQLFPPSSAAKQQPGAVPAPAAQQAGAAPVAAAAAQPSAVTSDAGLAQQAQQAQSQAPLLGKALPAAPSGAVLAAAGAAGVALLLGGAAVFGLFGQAGLGSAAGKSAAAAEEDALEEEEEEGPAVEKFTRAGVKSHLYSHMKVQRAPTTTPAVGGRLRRRPSNDAMIESGGEDEGMPSVAPAQPEPRSTAKPRARKQQDSVATKERAARTPRTTAKTAKKSVVPATVPEGEPAEPAVPPSTIRRSRRLGL